MLLFRHAQVSKLGHNSANPKLNLSEPVVKRTNNASMETGLPNRSNSVKNEQTLITGGNKTQDSRPF
jgi:hypothetical protein